MKQANGADTYSAMDFSKNAGLAQALFASVDHEAVSLPIRLSDHVEDSPADMTPKMVAWYRTHVAGPRRAALDAVKARATSLNQLTSGSGIFLEQALDEIEKERVREKRQALVTNMEQNKAKYEKLGELRQDYEKSKVLFESLSSEYMRPPVLIHWWYYAVLVLVALAELAINFETFNSISYMTPAIAAGTSLVIAFALALSSHCWGTLVRHFSVLFDPSQDDRERWAIWQMMGLGTTTLGIVLAAVWWARESYFSDIIAEITALGGEPPNRLGIIGGSMLSNMIVWIVGVLWAFFLHDPDPRFPRAFKDQQQKDEARAALQEKLDRPLQHNFEKIDATAQKAIVAATRKNSALGNVEEHQQARRIFEQVSEQDAKVMGVIETYRGELVNRIGELARSSGDDADRRPVFQRYDLVHRTGDEWLTPSQYAALPLRMKYV